MKLDSPFIPADVNKTAVIVLKLVEPLPKLAHTTWMDNFHSLSTLVKTLKIMNKTNKLNRKYVLKAVKIRS
jgi:hypothetical protein